MDHHRFARPALCTLVTTVLALALPATTAGAEQAPVSARFLAQAIADTGWYQMDECPPSAVDERSAPGCARIPASVDTAVGWLDLIDRAVFAETRREGDWMAQRDMMYATWYLEVTGQRYLLVLAPHPHRPVTMLYVSELAAADVTASSR
jgi:hypothetical protein